LSLGASIRTGAIVLGTIAAAFFSVVPASASFPGRNGKIAFTTFPPEPQFQVETIDADGSGRAVLTAGSSPAWSADGRKLAFAFDFFDAGGGGSQIVAINADGTGRTVIVDECGSSCKIVVGTPSWSPDGTQLAFHTTVCGASECGTSLSIVTSSGMGAGGLGAGFSTSWSPDGSRIALDRYADFGSSACQGGPLTCNSEIYTVAPDGSGLIRVTNNSADDAGPSWSPDGRKIAFTSGRDGNGEIYTINADGTGEKRLTDNAAVDTNPAWSPDGSKIAFSTNRDGNYEIYVMNADGTGLANLTNTPVNEFDPDWQPLPDPQPEDYKNAAQFCKALREFLGDESFRSRYGGGANAYGKCVSGDRQ
jgi:Tol biopolymer transport system component